jgi:hypothetical protein
MNITRRQILKVGLITSLATLSEAVHAVDIPGSKRLLSKNRSSRKSSCRISDTGSILRPCQAYCGQPWPGTAPSKKTFLNQAGSTRSLGTRTIDLQSASPSNLWACSHETSIFFASFWRTGCDRLAQSERTRCTSGSGSTRSWPDHFRCRAKNPKGETHAVWMENRNDLRY